jgi:hypothetical protein
VVTPAERLLERLLRAPPHVLAIDIKVAFVHYFLGFGNDSCFPMPKRYPAL